VPVPSSVSETGLEYPQNGTVSPQPPAAVSAGNGSSRSDRREFYFRIFYQQLHKENIDPHSNLKILKIP
jgi:hypothetical protein